MIIIFSVYFQFIEMSTLCREKVSQDSIPELNAQVTYLTSSQAVDNSAPETCNKIMKTDESYLSDLTVRS